MKRAPLIVALFGGSSVQADEAVELREGSEPSALLAEPGPLLELDPVLRPHLQGLGAVTESERTVIPLGRKTLAILEGTWWANIDSDDPRRTSRVLDMEGRGWGAGARLSHDLGFARLEVYASLNHVDTRYGSGTYRDVGVSVIRTWRLSRWMTAWIALSIGRRSWSGLVPPAGEANATQATLSIGTTFR